MAGICTWLCSFHSHAECTEPRQQGREVPAESCDCLALSPQPASPPRPPASSPFLTVVDSACPRWKPLWRVPPAAAPPPPASPPLLSASVPDHLATSSAQSLPPPSYHGNLPGQSIEGVYYTIIMYAGCAINRVYSNSPPVS